MTTMKFCIFRNESNLIESFELPKILNSSKFLNYLIQIHSYSFPRFSSTSFDLTLLHLTFLDYIDVKSI